MNLQFKHINIKEFLSVGEINIDLQNRGLSLVRGINNYEPKLESNGSGKSSIFDSIIWCLTGYTTRDVSKVSNENLDNGACVCLELSIDNHDYKITRCENPKTLTIIRDEFDISGTTYTKSQSILDSEFGWVNYDILISIIVLSQGLPGRFTSLKPKDRKSRLESLSGIDGDLMVLIDKVNKVYNEFSEMKSSCNSNLFELTGKISSCENAILMAQMKIDELKMKDPISEEDYNLIKKEYDSRNELYSKLNTEIAKTSSELNEVNRKYYSVVNNIRLNERFVEDTKSKLIQYLESKCPTCGATRDFSKEIIECQKKISDILKLIEDDRSLESKLKLEINNISSQLEGQREQNAHTLDGQNERSQRIKDYEMTQSSIEIYENSIKENQDQISEFKETENLINKQLEQICKQIEISSFFKNNLNKKFRTYLLEEVIKFMNQSLAQLSKYLYAVQGIVRLESSGNNINIYLGDREFGALSGGEGRRVDLILQLAQRSLCEVQSGFSCNLLVIDEILDYLDSVGVDNVLSLLETNSTNVDTLMVVTQRSDLNINFDSVLTVVKNEDQISSLRN